MATSILWRRLDAPGHDACRLRAENAGWALDGTSVCRHDGVPARLSYQVVCDSSWRSLRGRVRGWLGPRSIDLTVACAADGAWTLDGALVPGLHDLVDLDLAFTPATNLPQLRRVALAEGQSADVPVAWLDVSAGTLQRLPQRYRRRTQATYWYEAPSVGYQGLLKVDAAGFILRYPGLWEAER